MKTKLITALVGILILAVGLISCSRHNLKDDKAIGVDSEDPEMTQPSQKLALLCRTFGRFMRNQNAVNQVFH